MFMYIERNEKMSQEKVNRYKADKKNRKKAINKAKRTDLYINLFLIAVTVIICAFIAWSVYAKFFKKAEPVKTVNNLTSGEIEKIIDRHTDSKSDSSEDSSDNSSETVSEDNSETESASESETETTTEITPTGE